MTIAAYSQQAAAQHRAFASARRAALIEDVEFLLAVREHPERIAARVGKSCAAVCRALYRAERPDLARVFDRFS